MKRKLFKFTSLLIAATMLLTSVGCGGEKKEESPKSSENQQAPQTPNDNAAPPADGEVVITFWHAMGGKPGEALTAMVTDFNDEFKGKIRINEQFQGTYDDSLTKIKSSQLGNFEADIVQVYDIGTRLMIDSGWIIPVEELAAKDPEWKKDDLVPTIAAYYTVDNTLYSLPFNTSTPVYFYNKTMFEQASLDPNSPPTTIEEIIVAGKKLSDAGFKEPIGIASYGWFFEQFLCKQLLPYVDNGNGRENPAEKTVFKENGGGLNALNAWNSLYESGVARNLGRQTKDTKAAFIAGDIAMTFESSSGLTDLVSSIGDKFKVGAGFYPSLDAASKGGVSIGGGSVWVLKNDDTSKQDAVWQFLKYASRPDVQAKWAMGTGYFPTVKAAYDDADFIKYVEDFPQLAVAIEQLNAAPIESRGALFTVFPQARQIVEENIEKMVLKEHTPEQAIDKMTKAIDLAIEDYNIANN